MCRRANNEYFPRGIIRKLYFVRSSWLEKNVRKIFLFRSRKHSQIETRFSPNIVQFAIKVKQFSWTKIMCLRNCFWDLFIACFVITLYHVNFQVKLDYIRWKFDLNLGVATVLDGIKCHISVLIRISYNSARFDFIHSKWALIL